MASQQLQMILQPLPSPSVTEGPTMQERRALPKGQVQPLDVRSVQLPRILRSAPHLIPPPRRTDPGFPLHTNYTILPALLDNLTIQARSPEKSSNNLPIELESVGCDQGEMVSRRPGTEFSEQGERVAITSFANNRRRPEARPDFDGSEDPNRMPIATDHSADLIGLQFLNVELRDP